MATERNTIDISRNPDLMHLAEEARRRNTATVLTNGDEAVAIVRPIADRAKERPQRSPFRKPSQADIDAFLAAAGGWKDPVDNEG